MNTTSLPMAPVGDIGDPSSIVTYRPTVSAGGSCLTRRVKIVICMCLMCPFIVIGLFVGLLIIIIVTNNTNDSEWNIKCRFTDQNKTQYFPGDIVSGTIEFINSNHQKLELSGINATLVGKLVYTATKYKNSDSTKTRHEVEFFKQYVMLQPISNQSEFLLPLGNYSWPFSSRLGHPLPPSIGEIDHWNWNPYIRYFVQFKLIRPKLYNRFIEKECPIIVQYSSTCPVNVTRVEKNNWNENGVHVHVILQKNVIAPGKNLIFDIEVYNPRQVPIIGILTTLVQIWEIGSSAVQRINLFDHADDDIHSFQAERFNVTCQLSVPYTIAPTCSFQVPPSGAESPLNISYELVITVGFTDLATDMEKTMETRLPLIVTNPIQKTTAGILPPPNKKSLSFN